jgi:DNA-binding transcriptional ArsR family regulator
LTLREHLYTFTDVQVLTGADHDAVRPGSAEPVIEPAVAVELAELFRLLGDPTRVRILFALLQAGELCVHDIASAVDASETKVSQAMRLLRNAGVVRNRRYGRNVIYRLDDAHVRLLLEVSREHVAHAGVDG